MFLLVTTELDIVESTFSAGNN